MVRLAAVSPIDGSQTRRGAAGRRLFVTPNSPKASQRLGLDRFTGVSSRHARAGVETGAESERGTGVAFKGLVGHIQHQHRLDAIVGFFEFIHEIISFLSRTRA